MEEKLISQKKPFFPIINELTAYLKQYNRWVFTPIFYEDLLRFSGSIVVYDENEQDTEATTKTSRRPERREEVVLNRSFSISSLMDKSFSM